MLGWVVLNIDRADSVTLLKVQKYFKRLRDVSRKLTMGARALKPFQGEIYKC